MSSGPSRINRSSWTPSPSHLPEALRQGRVDRRVAACTMRRVRFYTTIFTTATRSHDDLHDAQNRPASVLEEPIIWIDGFGFEAEQVRHLLDEDVEHEGLQLPPIAGAGFERPAIQDDARR